MWMWYWAGVIGGRTRITWARGEKSVRYGVGTVSAITTINATTIEPLFTCTTFSSTQATPTIASVARAKCIIAVVDSAILILTQHDVHSNA
jgi:hypothetical protein